MWIQVLLILAVVWVAIYDVRSRGGGARHQALRRLMLVGFVALAGISILLPDWVTRLAEGVGVGRGTDLVLYALVVAFLSYVMSSHRKINEQQRKITVLARRIALDEAAARRRGSADRP